LDGLPISPVRTFILQKTGSAMNKHIVTGSSEIHGPGSLPDNTGSRSENGRECVLKNFDLARILFTIAALPRLREARILEIKRRIDSGTYRVDAWKIAGKMLRHV
jgi:hypothetical protein